MVHNYLDSLNPVGKVLSFSSIIDVATQLNNNKALGTLEMGVLYSKIPDTIKKEIVDPYISIFNIPKKIARIRSQDYLNPKFIRVYNKENLPIEDRKSVV